MNPLVLDVPERGLATAPLGPTCWPRQWGGRCESEGEGKGKHNQRRDEGSKGGGKGSTVKNWPMPWEEKWRVMSISASQILM